ncbi:PAS domain S-box-containing protein [Tistlia consotensis]|uniref:histidine kinase n=1 Tax=Tistlia consotensis USBA 355 TaxID=560819 RepID=A0A1Y6BB21_9PROT|nr:PAS-domain containing protein [Tistlia consotensis]SME94102.1 PAS domain S-box-containing protein [Tistlia consotensis USBA 355]SNR29046.1 PAS domain S-box-containing protein [Tistlia consotensis]
MDGLPVIVALALLACVLLAVALLLRGRLRALGERSGELERRLAESGAALAAAGRESAEREAGNEALSAERDRQAAEASRLAALLDALPQPIWARDETMRVTYSNRAYRRAVGAERDAAAINGASAELFEGGDLSESLRLGKRVLAEGGTSHARFHAVIDGERRLLEVSQSRLEAGGLLATARDLTDWEEMKGELARHVAAEREVLEKLGVGIAILGGDLHVRFHNTAYLRLWKLDEAFLSGEPHMGEVLDRLREQRRLPEQVDFTEFRRQYLRRLQTLIEPFEELEHLPDGTTVRVSVHPHPFGGVLVTYEDVTDTLKLERTYNTLLEVQRATLDNLYEGVAVYGGDGRLKLSNPAFQRIWNLPDELLAREPHVRELVLAARDLYDISEARWPEYLERLVGRVTEPEPRTGRRERADGSVIDFAQVPLPDGACLYTFLDVTDSTMVERALRDRNDALETTDRLKSEFLANISYELRTPLNAIVGFAEILQKQYFGELNERQLDYSQAIVESSQRLIGLINDILDLASIEAGYLRLDQSPVDLHALLVAAQNLWRERARARGLDLVLDCPENIGALECDERRMTQALFNLLSNAFKFTPEGGTITLSAERVEGEVRISVSDTGIGIPLQDQARVFGKFERVDYSGSRGRQPGAGLGLSLVKSLIELHGGWIEMESAVDLGTKVICHLPAKPQVAREPERLAGQ